MIGEHKFANTQINYWKIFRERIFPKSSNEKLVRIVTERADRVFLRTSEYSSVIDARKRALLARVARMRIARSVQKY